MKDLIEKMNVEAKKEFYKQNYEHDDGKCTGINTSVDFNFNNKKYNVELDCWWEKGHSYSYKLKDNNKIISDGFVRM